MKKGMLLFFALMSMSIQSIVMGASITYTFANGQITGTSPKYYEFDVMVQGGTAGTRIGDTQVYFNYNSIGFGSNVVANGKITVTLGALFQGELVPGLDLYTLVNVADNTSSKVSITTQYNYPGAPTSANLLPTSATQCLHIKIEIADPGQSSGLSFDGTSMTGQSYESDNTTKYSPVNASDTDDSSLPVCLSNFFATTSQMNGVLLSWTTQTEVNCAGFHVWKSDEHSGPFTRITTALIPGHGNSSSAHDYSYSDKNVREGNLYWYKIEEISTDQTSQFFGPICVMGVNTIPDAFALLQNFPNPFNPETEIKYQLPEESQVQILIVDILGREVATLVNEKQLAGYYSINWDGRDSQGQTVSNGTYLYVMKAKETFIVKKMLYLK